MSMPKDFSEDGAAGASGPPQGTSGTFGNSSSGGAIPQNWLSNGALAPNGYGGVWNGNQITQQQASDEFGAGALGQGALGLMFEDGGTVPDQDDAGAGADPSGDTPGGDPTSGTGDPISLALTTVDNALAYGRKLNGLPSSGGDSQQAAAMPTIPGNQSDTPGPYQPGQPRPQQQAANMPMQPPSQSESGVKPLQPMPGRLPPTSNPFGKRTAANEPGDGDGDGDDTTPTIPTGDDEEETA